MTTEPPSQPPALLSQSITIGDIDEFTELLVDWDSDWRQLEVGQATNQIELIMAQSTVIQRVRLSHAVHQRGAPPGELVTFGIPWSTGPSVWRDRHSAFPGIFDFNGANGYDCVSEADFDGLTLSFPRERFVAVAERLKLDTESFLDGRVWKLSGEGSCVLGEFRSYLCELYERATRTLNAAGQSLVLKQMDDQLPDRLFFAMASHTQEVCDQPLKARQKGLRQSIEYMEEHCHRSPGIPEVCVSVGLSWRSLDRAFKECFGIGPKRYLLNLRLTQARRALKCAAGGAKVADVANDWGFWHMGDFAREYRLMFGELPAKTLAK